MKNPDRIPNVLNLLHQLWELTPDVRLGQLLINLSYENEDLFVIEDDLLEKRITQAIKAIKRPELTDKP